MTVIGGCLIIRLVRPVGRRSANSVFFSSEPDTKASSKRRDRYLCWIGGTAPSTDARSGYNVASAEISRASWEVDELRSNLETLKT